MKTQKTDVVVYDKKFLQDVSNLGMRGVDPLDIRPPQILLIQASSDASSFKTIKDESPAIGQYFHTGRNEIMDTFECFFLLAAKGKYMDKNKTPPEERDQYRTIGCMTDDLKPFMMNFRSSALYALSPLFTAVASLGRPMFSLKVMLETKELQNSVGKKWRIPVVRIVGPETDDSVLNNLYNLALSYDSNTAKFVADKEDEPELEAGEDEATEDKMPF